MGTGGGHLYAFTTVTVGSQARVSGRYGALRLDLMATGYRWAFLSESGAVLDAGTGTCSA